MEHVTFSYPSADKEVFRHLDLELRPGDRLVLAGKNGSGKSTLLRLLAGLIAPSKGKVETMISDRPGATGLVQQRPDIQLVASTVEREIAFGLENMRLAPALIREKVDSILEQTGLEPFRFHAPTRLSAGEMQRVAFAAVMAMEPELWLLDEPAAFLDPFERERFYRLLELIPDRSALIYAASFEDEWKMGNRYAFLEAGGIHEGIPGGKTRSGNIREPSRRNGLPEDGGNTLHSEPLPSTFTLEAHNIRAVRKELFGPGREVLHGVDLKIDGGEIVALVGRNGSGKTTLIEALAGLADRMEGQVRWQGTPPEKMRGKIGVAFQFPERVFFAETVLEEILYGMKAGKLNDGEARLVAWEALDAFGLDPDPTLVKSPFELSRGEARRVALASIWAMRPAVYLLDEPTAGLDPEGCDRLGEMLEKEARRGCVILLAGHDTERFSRWAKRWLLLEEGKLVRDGDPWSWWKADPELPWPAPKSRVSLQGKGLMPGKSSPYNDKGDVVPERDMPSSVESDEIR